MKLSVLAVCLSLIFTAKAHSSALSFADAYELAQTAATDLAIARYKVESADSDRAVALGRILPQVSLFGQFSDNRIEYDSELSIADQSFYGQRYGVQLRQSLINVSDGLEISRLEFVKRQAQEDLAIVEAELLAGLIQSYLTVLLADADLEQSEAELQSLERQLIEATALYDRNLLPVTQLLEVQTRADTVRADVIMARGYTLVAREELSQFIGGEAGVLLDVEDAFALINRFATAEEASKQASLNSPTIAAALAAVDAARKGVDREKATRIPKVDLTYSYQHSDVGFDNLQSPARDTSTLAVSFNYPLFEGGAGVARLRGAKARFNSAETIYRAEVLSAEARARTAWLNFQALTERLVAGKQAITSAKTSLDASRKAVLAGTARVSDVLIALAQNTKAQRDYSQAKFEYAMGWVELEMAAGADPSRIAFAVSRAMHGH